MKIRFLPASECPHNLPIITSNKQNPRLYCAIIEDPDHSTEQAIKLLVSEYGANSESYMRFHRINPSKYRGTGSGNDRIQSYIMPYQAGGYTQGIFYYDNIKEFIEEKIKEIFSNDCVKTLQIANK